MTKGELKERLSDEKLFNSIVTIVNDDTLSNVGKKDQLEGLIYLHITKEYWCNSNDSDNL